MLVTAAYGSDGVLTIVLEAMEELLLNLALQMPRDDCENGPRAAAYPLT